MPRREQSGEAKRAGQSFEASLAALERVVRELERGDLPLEKSLELFEQGVRLSRECQERLTEADRRIEVILSESDGRVFVAPFDAEGFGRDEPETDAEEGEPGDGSESVF